MIFLVLLAAFSYYVNASGPFTFQVADGVPFDPDGTELVSENVQDAIEELHFGNVQLQFDAYSDTTAQSTTSNGWVTKSGYPYTAPVKPAGTYMLTHSAEIGQSDKEKVVGSRVQWRQGTSGTWITLSDIREAVSVDDGAQLRTGFSPIELTSDTNFQVRYQWGQPDDGGTGTIDEAGIWFIRVKNP